RRVSDLRAGDVADAEEAVEPEVAVADRKLVAVERSRGWTRGAVAFHVELAAVAGTAKAARRHCRNEPHLAVRGLLCAVLLVEHRPVRLCRTANVRAPARHRRDAR